MEVNQSFGLLSKKALLIRAQHGADADIEVQKQILDGEEVIIGFKRDPSFGAACLFGIGGVTAELMADRNISLLPLDEIRATQLIKQSKAFPLLHGWRGAAPYAISALATCVVQLATLFVQSPEIAELEVNPVIVTRTNAWAADARIILS
jgi:acetyltransferase